MREAAISSGRWSSRFGSAEARFAAEKPRKPKQPVCDDKLVDSRCPYCEQPLDRTYISISSLLLGGVRQLAFALLMIAFALVRCLRFVVALTLCVLGFVGSCCRVLGMQIAHGNDRQLLQKL